MGICTLYENVNHFFYRVMDFASSLERSFLLQVFSLSGHSIPRIVGDTCFILKYFIIWNLFFYKRPRFFPTHFLILIVDLSHLSQLIPLLSYTEFSHTFGSICKLYADDQLVPEALSYFNV